VEACADQDRNHRRPDGSAQACGRRNRDRAKPRDDHASGQQHEAELAERTREKSDEMNVTLRKRHGCGEAHGRADGDDERALRHGGVELLEGHHWLEGEERHGKTGRDEYESGFIPLDEGVDGRCDDDQGKNQRD